MTQLANRLSAAIPVVRPVERSLKVTVLAGGPSAEREVSLKSGRAIAAALESRGHEVHLADISPDDLEALEEPVDLVFIALHGTFGEDGQVQQLLDQREIRYCGSGAFASALAMDKVAAKCCFIENGIPTPRFDVVNPDRMDKVLAHWTAPVVVKPHAEGSSLDCHIIREADGMRTSLQWLVEHYGRCLIEEYIGGPELTVGILDDEALPPIQIRTKREYYNYEAKYLDDDTEYIFEIDLPSSLIERIKSLSVKAHNSLGCLDFSRADWVVDGNTHQPYLLEVNTIPGFTDHSLLPKAAQMAGLDFAMLCQRIVELACQR